jgi:hypothetical protein
MEIKFDVAKLLVVEIDKIQPNPWNPKQKDTAEYKVLVEGIRVKGQRLPIVVRELGDKYEILDGEQRWRACQELKFKKVLVYNEGKVDDKEAKELTLWYQHQVPFDEILLAKLVFDMSTKYDEFNVPFSKEKIQEMVELMKFDWDSYQKNTKLDIEPREEGLKTLSITMLDTQYKVIMQAFDKARKTVDTGDMSDARALELICADYLAGA